MFKLFLFCMSLFLLRVPLFSPANGQPFVCLLGIKSIYLLIFSMKKVTCWEPIKLLL